ncbi:hypothetical protein ACHHYP_05518 [Achlya hypogyna]|uniref:Secreted protein n=1 Tax=Achlya hypogyna TaxID=1202772 RepID=A0A1V9YXP1_ACHHY|nr:hypothetical protein ACHHYP_05518 [Achlya hypogyna]
MQLSLLTTALLATAASAVEFRFTNRCHYTINLRGPGGAFLCDIAPGQTKGNNCGANVSPGSHSLFKHTASDQANCTSRRRWRVTGSTVWYDMSNVRPGSDHCTSFDDCARHTGNKSGFNVPVDVIPTRHNNGRNCRKLHDVAPNSPDAFLFPGDNLKNHDCPIDEVFDVVYCPGGRLLRA